MNNAVIVGYSRAAFTIANKGKLISVRPEDILSEVIRNLIVKSKINPEDIEDIIEDFESGFKAARKPRLVSNQ